MFDNTSWIIMQTIVKYPVKTTLNMQVHQIVSYVRPFGSVRGRKYCMLTFPTNFSWKFFSKFIFLIQCINTGVLKLFCLRIKKLILFYLETLKLLFLEWMVILNGIIFFLTKFGDYFSTVGDPKKGCDL